MEVQISDTPYQNHTDKNNISSKINTFVFLPHLQQINSFMFSFLWNNKPDKVKRNTICGDYLNGDLKMINIFNFEKALKLNWIRKVIHQTEASWKLLLLDSDYKLSNITLIGGSFPFKPQAP